MTDKQLQGQFEAILMTITGRDGIIGELSGPGVEVLAGRGAAQQGAVGAGAPD